MGPPDVTPLAFGPGLNTFQDVARQWSDAVAARLDAAVAAVERERHRPDTVVEARAYCRGIRERWLRVQGGLPGDPAVPRDGGFETRGAARGTWACGSPGWSTTCCPASPSPDCCTRPTPPPDGGRVREAAGASSSSATTRGRPSGWPSSRGVCLDLALHGLVTLAIDPWGQGEREQYTRPVRKAAAGAPRHLRALLQRRAVPPHRRWRVCRYFAWDAVRAVDLLAAPAGGRPRAHRRGRQQPRGRADHHADDGRRATGPPPCPAPSSRAEPKLFCTGQTLDLEPRFCRLPGGEASTTPTCWPASLPGHSSFGAAAYDYFPVEGDGARLSGGPPALRPARAPPIASGWPWAGTGTCPRPQPARGGRCASSLASGRARSATRRLALPSPAGGATSICSAYRPGLPVTARTGAGIYHLNRDFLAVHRRTPPASAP